MPTRVTRQVEARSRSKPAVKRIVASQAGEEEGEGPTMRRLARHRRLRLTRLRFAASAVCYLTAAVDANTSLLVYHPSGRSETRFERVAHGLLIGGGCLIGTLFLTTGVLGMAGRSHGKRRDGLCVTCGYDLRASPERCPECGTAATSSSA